MLGDFQGSSFTFYAETCLWHRLLISSELINPMKIYCEVWEPPWPLHTSAESTQSVNKPLPKIGKMQKLKKYGKLRRCEFEQKYQNEREWEVCAWDRNKFIKKERDWKRKIEACICEWKRGRERTPKIAASVYIFSSGP